MKTKKVVLIGPRLDYAQIVLEIIGAYAQIVLEIIGRYARITTSILNLSLVKFYLELLTIKLFYKSLAMPS